MSTLGIDISKWQSVSSYEAAANAVSFVMLKMGGSNTGERYTDSRYAQHASGFAGKVPVGSYWMNGAGPVARDAEYFLANVRSDASDFFFLDIEEIDGFGAWGVEAALEWVGIVRAGRPGVPIYAYMNSSEAARRNWKPLENAGVELWVANYGSNDGTRSNPIPSTGSWSGWAVHQYTDKGSVAGIPGGVDLNYALTNPAKGNESGGFLMALSDTQQKQMYAALVAQTSGGNYYKLDAATSVARKELGGPLAKIRAGEIFYPGEPYHAFVALINEIRKEGGGAQKPVTSGDLQAAIAEAMDELGSDEYAQKVADLAISKLK